MKKPLLFSFVVLALATVASAQQLTSPLWPEAEQGTQPERDTTSSSDQLIAGRPLIRLTNVSKPTMTVYRPNMSKNTGAAVLVFPGGGYHVLAYDLEGTEVCAWLNSIDMTCVLVKYRVPSASYYPENMDDLEDAQQAMRLTRNHAAEWQIDPQRVGVLGFSAGAHLAATLSTHADYAPAGASRNQQVDARPDFTVLVYPAYLVLDSDLSKLKESVRPTSKNPPTFLVQSEDDPVHEENALRYFQALKEVGVPAELHIFSEGGHGYGLRPTGSAVTRWPDYAERWFHSIHLLGDGKQTKAAR